jgi:hypothetical protein
MKIFIVPGSAVIPPAYAGGTPNAAYLLQSRPEGPSVNKPDRQVGRIIRIYKASRVPHLRCSLFVRSYPGLTAGPIHCRSFGPEITFLQKVCDIGRDADAPGNSILKHFPHAPIAYPMTHDNPANFVFRFTQRETGNRKQRTLFSDQDFPTI